MPAQRHASRLTLATTMTSDSGLVELRANMAATAPLDDLTPVGRERVRLRESALLMARACDIALPRVVAVMLEHYRLVGGYHERLDHDAKHKR